MQSLSKKPKVESAQLTAQKVLPIPNANERIPSFDVRATELEIIQQADHILNDINDLQCYFVYPSVEAESSRSEEKESSRSEEKLPLSLPLDLALTAHSAATLITPAGAAHLEVSGMLRRGIPAVMDKHASGPVPTAHQPLTAVPHPNHATRGSV
ncbi:hypothetical protein M8J76_008133 [Diaphorina citri]|nr:hypothetical protein M8J76_008133 [Diaphorina citri]